MERWAGQESAESMLNTSTTLQTTPGLIPFLSPVIPTLIFQVPPDHLERHTASIRREARASSVVRSSSAAVSVGRNLVLGEILATLDTEGLC